MAVEEHFRSPSPSGRGARGEGSPPALLLSTALLVLFACGPDLPPDLEIPPLPDLTSVEPTVREQLDDERARLDALLERRTRHPELAAAFGRMGQLYNAYELSAPAAACYRNALRLAPSPQWRYHLGDVYRRQGQLDAAAEVLSEAARELPENAPVRLRLGRLELNRGRPAAARTHFARALAADPECGAARYELGEAARASGDFERAADYFRQTLAEQPYALQVLYPLGQTLLRLGRDEEARGYLTRSAERRVSVGGRPTCPDPWDEELAGMTRSAAAHLTRGLHAAYNGRHEEALAQYRKALALAPEDPVVRQSLGSSLAAIGDQEGALEQYREAVRLAPADPDLHRDLGAVAGRLGRLEEARRHLETALELRPDYLAARLQLAAVAQKGGRFERAVELYTQVLEEESDHRQAWLERARSLIRLGRSVEVTEELGGLLDRKPPQDPAERLHLAVMLGALGDRDRAARHMNAVLELDAPLAVHAQAHLRLGQVRLFSGDLRAAAESFRAALELDPSLEDAKAALDRLSRSGRG